MVSNVLKFFSSCATMVFPKAPNKLGCSYKAGLGGSEGEVGFNVISAFDPETSSNPAVMANVKEAIRGLTSKPASPASPGAPSTSAATPSSSDFSKKTEETLETLYKYHLNQAKVREVPSDTRKTVTKSNEKNTVITTPLQGGFTSHVSLVSDVGAGAGRSFRAHLYRDSYKGLSSNAKASFIESCALPQNLRGPNGQGSPLARIKCYPKDGEWSVVSVTHQAVLNGRGAVHCVYRYKKSEGDAFVYQASKAYKYDGGDAWSELSANTDPHSLEKDLELIKKEAHITLGARLESDPDMDLVGGEDCHPNVLYRERKIPHAANRYEGAADPSYAYLQLMLGKVSSDGNPMIDQLSQSFIRSDVGAKYLELFCDVEQYCQTIRREAFRDEEKLKKVAQLRYNIIYGVGGEYNLLEQLRMYTCSLSNLKNGTNTPYSKVTDIKEVIDDEGDVVRTHEPVVEDIEPVVERIEGKTVDESIWERASAVILPEIRESETTYQDLPTISEETMALVPASFFRTKMNERMEGFLDLKFSKEDEDLESFLVRPKIFQAGRPFYPEIARMMSNKNSKMLAVCPPLGDKNFLSSKVVSIEEIDDATDPSIPELMTSEDIVEEVPNAACLALDVFGHKDSKDQASLTKEEMLANLLKLSEKELKEVLEDLADRALAFCHTLRETLSSGKDLYYEEEIKKIDDGAQAMRSLLGNSENREEIAQEGINFYERMCKATRALEDHYIDDELEYVDRDYEDIFEKLDETFAKDLSKGISDFRRDLMLEIFKAEKNLGKLSGEDLKKRLEDFLRAYSELPRFLEMRKSLSGSEVDADADVEDQAVTKLVSKYDMMRRLLDDFESIETKRIVQEFIEYTKSTIEELKEADLEYDGMREYCTQLVKLLYVGDKDLPSIVNEKHELFERPLASIVPDEEELSTEGRVLTDLEEKELEKLKNLEDEALRSSKKKELEDFRRFLLERLNELKDVLEEKDLVEDLINSIGSITVDSLKNRKDIIEGLDALKKSANSL